MKISDGFLTYLLMSFPLKFNDFFLFERDPDLIMDNSFQYLYVVDLSFVYRATFLSIEWKSSLQAGK